MEPAASEFATFSTVKPFLDWVGLPSDEDAAKEIAEWEKEVQQQEAYEEEEHDDYPWGDDGPEQDDDEQDDDDPLGLGFEMG